jgi:hypothetical protein
MKEMVGVSCDRRGRYPISKKVNLQILPIGFVAHRKSHNEIMSENLSENLSEILSEMSFSL